MQTNRSFWIGEAEESILSGFKSSAQIECSGGQIGSQKDQFCKLKPEGSSMSLDSKHLKTCLTGNYYYVAYTS